MNLFVESWSAFRWMFRILRVFIRGQPLITLTTIGFAALSRVTGVLAFFLPLKVILLAGAQGVPGHFSFIDPAHKLDWIVWLSLAAVATYVLNILLDVFSERLAEAGSAGILERTNKLALIGKQRSQAGASFFKVTQAVSSATFALVGLLVLAFADMRLCIALLGLCFLEFLFTAVVMAGWRAAYPGRLQGFIRHSPAEYLNILSSLNFLASFFLILVPFLLTQEGNILLALLAVVVIRRTLPALETTVRIVADLYKERHAIDPLIFRGRQLRERESPESQVAREFFNKTARRELAEQRLLPLRPDLSGLEVQWQDSPIKGAYTFIISCASAQTGQRASFQQQVFPFKQAYLLENEDFLFSVVKRELLNAPPAIVRFREGSFECQICEYDGEVLSEEQYLEALPVLMADAWCFQPPKKLVTAFRATRPSLSGRLTPDFLERLDAACDSEAETIMLETLRRRLPEICARLDSLPLHILNSDMNHHNVVRSVSGDLRVMSWTRWAIEPVGVGIPEELPREKLPELVGQVNARRSFATKLTMQDIQLVEACSEFEHKIGSGRYKAAFRRVAKIIACL